MNKKRLYVLDANALLHRAWHAIPPLTAPDGRVVNAVYGVLMLVLKLWQEEHPDAMVACWDTEKPTFRHEAFEAYKAQRPEQSDELYAQIPWIQEGLQAMSVESVSCDGFEADDVIATIATRSHAQGWDVTVVTSDRDAFQLIRPGITVLSLKKGVSDTVRFDEVMLQQEYGLTPAQFTDYKIMRGDPSDNIPGIKGIGEKGATALLQEYGDLAAIMAAAHDVSSSLSASTRAKLLGAASELQGLRELIELRSDAPVDWQATAFSWPPDDLSGLRACFQSFGFKALLKRLDSATPNASAVSTPSSASTTIAIPTAHSLGKSRASTAVAESWSDFCATIPASGPIFVRLDHGDEQSLFGGSRTVIGAAVQTAAGLLVATTDVLDASFQSWVRNHASRIVMHDVKREMKALARAGIVLPLVSCDQMLAAYLLAAGERNHDLEQIAVTYAGVSPSVPWTLADQLSAMARAHEPVTDALHEAGLDAVLARFDMPLIPILFAMEETGILIDRAYLQDLGTTAAQEKLRLEREMQAMADAEFNPASPKQLSEILFTKLALPTKGIKKSTQGYSTAASELEKLHGQHPIIERIEDYREVSKLLSTYIDVLPGLADAHGRVHTTFNQAVAATGRLSSTDPNLQNIPIRTELGRGIRRAFIARPGYKLVSCDYSQIELRVVAALANDAAMLEAFRQDADIHRATAASIWDIPFDAVTSDQRRIAKAINFGLIFGQGPQGLAAAADISFAEAKTFIAKYFDVYKGVKTYMEETKARAHSLGYVETLFGRRRLLPEIHSSMPQLRAAAERMAINMPVQGTDADLMKLAMIEVAQQLPHMCPDARLVLQVHDELVFEVPEADVARVAQAMRDIMEHVEKIGVPIRVDAKAGSNWAEMEKIV